MTAPTAVPEVAAEAPGRTPEGLWHSTFRAMACYVRVLLDADTPDPAARHADVRKVFEAVERECTRFDETSDLMRANAAGDAWQPVGRWCFAALAEAAAAHRMTDGVFDPRVLQALQRLGYSASFEHVGETADSAPIDRTAGVPGPWHPGFDEASRSVRIGPVPVDLGGIGKGLALRWAAERLRDAQVPGFLLDAGGDCVASGAGPDGTGWRVGVEDPRGDTTPLAVLAVTDRAVTTSSVRVRRWRAEGRTVHHLIDARTGEPGGTGLSAVTVVGRDPAESEVWSKVLFLHGTNVAEVSKDHELAAFWVDAGGNLHGTPAAEPFVIWRPA